MPKLSTKEFKVGGKTYKARFSGFDFIVHDSKDNEVAVGTLDPDDGRADYARNDLPEVPEYTRRDITTILLDLHKKAAAAEEAKKAEKKAKADKKQKEPKQKRRVACREQKIEIRTEKLPVDLTKEELASFATDLAEKSKTIDEIKAEKKIVMKGYKDRLDELEEIRRVLYTAIDTGLEHREVEVEIHFDYENKRVEHYRSDTGVMIRERPMSADELQEKLI